MNIIIGNILLKEGFLSYSENLDIECDPIEEAIWNLLKNKEDEKVHSGRLMIFLGAVMNIYINMPEIMTLSMEEVNKIHKDFSSYSARKSSNAKAKIKPSVKINPYPKLCKNSLQLVSQSRSNSKMYDQCSILINEEKQR